MPARSRAQPFGADKERTQPQMTKPSRSGRAGPTRSAPPTTGSAPTSRCSPRWPRRSSCASSTTTAGAPAWPWTRSTPTAGTATCPAVEPGPAVRLPGARAVGARARGRAATRPSCCSTRTPRPSRARSTGTRPCFPYDFGDENSPQRRATAPRTCPRRVVHNPYFDWGNDRPPGRPLHETVIYEIHVKGFTARHPDIPEAPAGHLRRPGPPGRHRVPRPSSASPPSS